MVQFLDKNQDQRVQLDKPPTAKYQIKTNMSGPKFRKIKM